MGEEQDIAFKVTVPGEGGKSLKDLKKDFNDIQKELANLKVGTKEYQHALERLGAVKDDIGDLRDTINALNPEGKVAAFAKVGSTIASGFAAAQGAAALFGAESEELQKTMLKVQAAMALAEGIKGIAGAADAFKVLNTVMKANPILAIVAGFTALAGIAATLYKNYLDVNSASAQAERNHAALTKSTDTLVKSIDSQIKALQGLKENDAEIVGLTEKRIKANIELQASHLKLTLIKQKEAEADVDIFEAAQAALGFHSEAAVARRKRINEAKDETQNSINSLKDAYADLSKFHNEQEQKKVDQSAEANAKSLTNHKQHLKDIETADKEANAEFAKRLDLTVQSKLDNEAKDKQAAADSQQAELDALKASQAEGEAEYKANKENEVVIDQEAENKKRAERQETINQGLGAAKQGLQATQQLTDLFFDHQLRKNKGNAAAELEIRKKQFKVNKAFGIVNAVVDGVGAVQKALNNPYPLNIVLAVISGLAAAANIAKIASSKFEGGDSSASPSDVGNVTASAPVVPQPNNTVTQISDDGKVTPKDPGPQKVFVLEGDIRDSNKRVTNIEETAKL